METAITKANRWWVLFPATTSVMTLGLFSSLNRPLLYDEFVYFMAAPLSFPEILGVIYETTTNVNQGVTGIYLFLDWIMLGIFGASDVALRLPSLVFGGLFLIYSFVFLRHRGAGLFALSLFPVFLITQELVMHYVGEARTYMPLAAGAMGLLAYYAAPWTFRRSWMGAAVGWSAAIIGVLFHPYIALYWPTVLVFGFWLSSDSRSLRALVKWANPPMVIVGTGIYAMLAAATWGRGRATAFVDPFNFLPGPLPVEIVIQNFYAAASPVMTILVAIAGLGVLGITLLTLSGTDSRSRLRALAHALAAPGVLFAIAFVMALLVSFSSVAADFWIFPRQWIASAALAAMALFWGGFEIYRIAANSSQTRGRLVAIICGSLIVVLAAPIAFSQLDSLHGWNTRPAHALPDRGELRDALDAGVGLNDADWMAYAQVNVDAGGRVWRDFRAYYLETDWEGFVLRD